ncbi:MAG TPA: BatD family protein [Rhodanobacteraceae bacterium]
MMRAWWFVVLLLLAPLASAASVHAFLNRSHVSLGDTVTLNIRSSGSVGTPDLAPLQRDFQVLGTSSSSSVAITNGKRTSSTQLGIALKPLHAGTLTIPALDVGGGQTRPLTLTVTAAPTGGSGQAGDPVFMEAGVLSSAPYVGQQTVYTLSLFYLPGVDGSIASPTANGARLIKLDRDQRYTVNRDGYAYEVIERSWAVVPQRSGKVTIDGPEFQGQQTATQGGLGALPNLPGAIFNGQIPGVGKPVQAVAPSVQLDVRAAPANGGTPWLPARKLQLRLTGLPANGQVNGATPLTVTLSISAGGQPAGALPEPELPSLTGAEVYPDQTRDNTDTSGEWLQGTRSRSFAIVPQRNGSLTIPAITLHWWNVQTGSPEQATVPAHTLQVSGVVAAAPVAPVASAAPAIAPQPATSSASATAASAARGVWFWRVLALVALGLWVVAVLVGVVIWRLRRRAAGPADAVEHRGDTGQGGVTTVGSVRVARAASAPAMATARPAARPDVRALQRQALDAARAGDVAACERGLLAWARASQPQLANLGALRAALADAGQRDALQALQRARWQGGDTAAACAACATAFARGMAWQRASAAARGGTDPLPPLYPS